ncbi:MAG: lytic transglycosylase domain-containing protein [Candidatus Hydrogenedentes bacterium]|nr:lytic transglycosylase domain-containing protein [Candidatus Hydrogenedentota bacterium]
MRMQNAGIHTFLDEDGAKVFTNRPKKYREKKGYVELKLDAIDVPSKFKTKSKSTPISPANTSGMADTISHYSRHYGVKESLVYAVIKAESNFQVRAQSPVGASGLMQLMPETAEEMGVTDIYDPVQNIAGGTQYLGKMLEIFNNDTKLALAAYNAGPNAVKEHGGVPPYRETQDYIQRVIRFEKEYRTGVAFKPGDLPVIDGLVKKKSRVKLPAPREKDKYLVYFHSGVSQPADKVEDKEPFYYIHYNNRTFPIRKDLVKKIVEAT